MLYLHHEAVRRHQLVRQTGLILEMSWKWWQRVILTRVTNQDLVLYPAVTSMDELPSGRLEALSLLVCVLCTVRLPSRFVRLSRGNVRICVC